MLLRKTHKQYLNGVAGIGMIVLMSVICIGIPYSFLVQQNAIRKEIKQQIKKGVPESELFTFNLKQIEKSPAFEWINDHEFRFEGQLFDITKRDGDVVKCINDTQEELLFRELDQLARNKMSATGKIKKYSISSFSVSEKIFVSDLFHPEINYKNQVLNFSFSYSGSIDLPPEIS